MKKVFGIVTVIAVLVFGMTANVMAQDVPAPEAGQEQVAEEQATPVEAVADEQSEVAAEEGGIVGAHKALKIKFIEGGAGFMALVAFCLIFGLALCIERILYLNLSAVNTKKLLSKIDEAWKKGGVEEAMNVCRNTRGPVASIFYQGLSRYDEGIDVVEKTVASYSEPVVNTFDDILNAAVNMYKEADVLQKAAEESEMSFALGYTDSIHDVAVAQQKANISLQYTVKITNAVVSAYKELMNMQL